MNILCIIANIPEKRWCFFLNEFKNYKVYIIVNDNEYDLTEYIRIYKNIEFIKIDESKCISNGYTNCEFSDKLINGWDKALYYFSSINTDYKNIWFMEDDVFIYNENLLINIDNKYKSHDILCNSSFKEAKLDEWLWKHINIKFPPPYFCGMMCAIRMSNKMLSCLKDYATKNKTLFFLEALFPTIAKYNKLIYISNPPEFLTVTHRQQWNLNELDCHHIYHPLKNLQNHIDARDMLHERT